jgi:hypothetical protein
VLIEGPAGTLTLLITNDKLYTGVYGWTLYSIDLDETGTPYGYGQYGDHAATQQEIQDVLAEVTDFRIRGDFVQGVELTYIRGFQSRDPTRADRNHWRRHGPTQRGAADHRPPLTSSCPYCPLCPLLHISTHRPPTA